MAKTKTKTKKTPAQAKKFDDLVKRLMKRGLPKKAAYAIATNSMKTKKKAKK